MSKRAYVFTKARKAALRKAIAARWGKRHNSPKRSPGGKKHPRRPYHMRSIIRRHPGHRNPAFLRGLMPIPTVGQVVAVGAAAIALPFLTRTVTNLLPIAALQGDGWGNILGEFAIGALVAGAANRFIGTEYGHPVLLLATARAVGRVAFKATQGQIGFSAYVDQPLLGVDDMGAYVDQVPTMGAVALPAIMGDE